MMTLASRVSGSTTVRPSFWKPTRKREPPYCTAEARHASVGSDTPMVLWPL